MKRLITILSAFTFIMCAFASCGEKKDKENSKSENINTSESVTAETEEEEETTQEDTTEEETTEAVTEESAEISDVFGFWIMDDDSMLTGFNVKEDGNISTFMDMSDVMHFTADGDLYTHSSTVSAENIENDGNVISFNVDGTNYVTMNRTSGNSNGLNGEYDLVSGMFYENVLRSFGKSSMPYIIVDDEMLYLGYKDVVSYTINGDTVSFSGLENIDYSFDTAEVKYEVKNDTLTLFEANEDGSNMVLKRFDFAEYKADYMSSESDGTEESQSADETEDSITGKWNFEEDESDAEGFFDIKDNGDVDMLINITEQTHFTADGGIALDKQTFGAECVDFDGKNLVVSINEMEAFSAVKDSGSADILDGEYTMKSGVIFDSVSGAYDNAEVYMIIEGEKMYFGYRKVLSYKLDGDNAEISGLKNLEYDSDSAVVKYRVSGDKLILESADNDGGDLTLVRVK